MTDKPNGLLCITPAQYLTDLNTAKATGARQERALVLSWLRQDWQGADNWGDWFAERIEQDAHKAPA